jgi:mono/diheme cytochrome c family protein
MSRKTYSVGWVIAIAVVTHGFFAGAVRAEGIEKPKVERGKYLVEFGGCHDCHSPKVFTPEGIPMPDPKRLLSGHPAEDALPSLTSQMVAQGQWVLFSPDLTAAVGPWGVTFAANLTPDDQTGIGLWTEDVFIKALRNGKHMGAGRPIMPPMPWFNMANVSDEDLGAIFAYLKSLPPITNPVPAPRSLANLTTKR